MTKKNAKAKTPTKKPRTTKPKPALKKSLKAKATKAKKTKTTAKAAVKSKSSKTKTATALKPKKKTALAPKAKKSKAASKTPPKAKLQNEEILRTPISAELPDLDTPSIDSMEDPTFRMTDDRRMRESGASASGYHAPSRQDIKDLRKSHQSSSSPGAVNADEFFRVGSSTDALEGPEGIANLHPSEGASASESRDFGMGDEEADEIPDDSFPAPTTQESQMYDDRKNWQGTLRSANGEGADGEEGIEGPLDGAEIFVEQKRSA